VPTRLHRVDLLADVITGGETIRKTFARFKKEGRGVFIYLRDGTAGVPVTLTGQEKMDSEAQRHKEWREIGLGAQILRDLGVSSIRLRTSTPRTYVGLSGFGIDITACEPVE
jgi:3,4-dihydroxy 2-butanone 4-phosphate synthase/GTP cyclohydrolase II